MGNNDRKRIWKLGKQASYRCYPGSKKEVQKAKKENKGISSKKIEKILNCCKSFIGCFPCDQLENLAINSFPCFIIVNTDHSGGQGLHWVVLRISSKSIELFDPLGLILTNSLPFEILSFIQRFTVSRCFKFNVCYQPKDSILCGFYCIAFIFLRQFCSFRKLLSYFSDKNLLQNEKSIIKFFK